MEVIALIFAALTVVVVSGALARRVTAPMVRVD
jgi:hypothetical protein